MFSYWRVFLTRTEGGIEPMVILPVQDAKDFEDLRAQAHLEISCSHWEILCRHHQAESRHLECYMSGQHNSLQDGMEAINLWAKERGSSGSSRTSLFWTDDFKNAKCTAAAKRFVDILAFFWLDTVRTRLRSNVSWMLELWGRTTEVRGICRTTKSRNSSIIFTQSTNPSKYWKFNIRLRKENNAEDLKNLTYWDRS